MFISCEGDKCNVSLLWTVGPLTVIKRWTGLYTHLAYDTAGHDLKYWGLVSTQLDFIWLMWVPPVPLWLALTSDFKSCTAYSQVEMSDKIHMFDEH